MRHKLPGNDARAPPPGRVRLSGVILIAAGLMLAALGSGLLAYAWGYFSLSDIFPGTYRDPNAEPVETPLGAYAFIGFMLLFGLAALAEGGWRVCFGRHNRYLLTVILVLGGIFFVAGMITEALG